MEEQITSTKEVENGKLEQLEERVSKIESKIWGFPQKTKEKK